MNKNFQKNCFLSAPTGLSFEKYKKSVFVVLTKTSILVLNFNKESAKKPTVYVLLFFIAVYYPKDDNKHPSEMRK